MKMECNFREKCQNTVCEHYYTHEHSSNCTSMFCKMLGDIAYCGESLSEIRKKKLDKLKNYESRR